MAAFGYFERLVAFRYLRARKDDKFASLTAIFSLIGIALGVATLIIVTGVMNGFQQDLLGKILAVNGPLTVYSEVAPVTGYQKIADKIRSVQGVTSVTPIMQGQVLFSSEGGYATGGIVRGISAQDLSRLKIISGNIKAGSLQNFGSSDVLGGADDIAVGIGMAEHLGLHIGSRVTLISPRGVATVIGTVPRILAFRVGAIFQVGMNQYDSTFAYIPLKAAQIFFNAPGAVSQFQVTVNNPLDIEPVDNKVVRALTGYPVRVLNWQRSNNSFFSAITVERNVMFIILSLIILVAAFNVISSMIMLVKDKTGDIAVLRTTGVSRGAVMRIFLMCGASIGFLGTILGTVLGIVFTLNINHIQAFLQSFSGTPLFNPEVYFLEQLPTTIIWSDVGIIVLMALVISVLATLYPSFRAAKTDPVEALRHE